MPDDRYFQHAFPNGLTLLCEKMPAMQSAAMTLLVPSGVSNDPPGKFGSSNVLCELTLRGAGSRDSRALTEHLDSLGLQRSSGAGTYHTRYGCAAVAPRVMESLATYADIVQRPLLADDAFEPSRDLALQALEGIDDDPRSKVFINLRKIHWPDPLGRNAMGEKPDLEALTLDDCRRELSHRFHARGAILALAGNIDFVAAKVSVEEHFGAWKAGNEHRLKLVESGQHYHYEHQQSEQTHIGLAYPTIDETHPEYYLARMANEVLSGGMSGRLFTEIREKRGLCYSVGASYSSLKGVAAIMGYAGTSNDRAQATLDCLVSELRRLSDGITSEELARAKIGLLASLIMSGESTSARAGAIAHDFFIRGRIRPLEELSASINAVTLDEVNAFLKRSRPEPMTMVIVGPKELKVPGE